MDLTALRPLSTPAFDDLSLLRVKVAKLEAAAVEDDRERRFLRTRVKELKDQLQSERRRQNHGRR